MKKIAACLSAVMLLSTFACAEVSEDTIYGISDSKPNVIQLSGAEVKPGGDLSLIMIKSGIAPEGLWTDGTAKSALVAYKQLTADENGNYSVIIDTDGVSGAYDVYVGAKKDEAPVKETVKYINTSLNKTKRNELNTALGVSASQAAAVMEEACADIGINDGLVSLAIASDYLAAAEILKASAADLSAAETAVDKAGIALAAEKVDKALAAALFKAGKTSLFGEGQGLFSYPEEIEKWYTETYMNDSAKSFVEGKMSRSFTNFDEFDKAFTEATALGVIKAADGFGEIKEYLTENAAVLGINSSKVTDAFAQSIVGKEYNSVIGTGINTFVDKGSTLKPSFGGGGGGGGGSSSGGGFASANKVVGTTSIGKPQTEEAAPLTDEAPDFVDMTGYEWAKDAVGALRTRGVVDGRSNGKFVPAGKVRREEFVKMILKAVDFENMYGTVDFVDVPESAWYYSSVKDAYLSGIVSGVSATHFGSGKDITRQDMAVMCYNALNKKGVLKNANGEGKTFADSGSISEYAASAIDALSAIGILNGNRNNEFMPKASASRAEAAQMIYNAILFMEKNS